MTPVVKVVEPEGVLDAVKGNQLRRDISDIVEKGVDIVLINLQKVTFIDSPGLGALVSAQRMVRGANAKLYLSTINEQVGMVFQLTRMDRVFDTFPSREAFEKSIS